MKQISNIIFTVFSPEQIRKMSACKVVVPDTYDEDGYPIPDGLADLKMGVIDPGLKCKTDGGRMRESMGHFGHIELVRPSIHPLFAKYIYSFLKATCYKCGESLDEDKYFEDISSKTCDKCGATQKEIKFIKPTTFFEGERRLLPTEIRERLERIPDETLKRWGIEIRPEWLVLTVLPIPPVTMRPSITLETGERSEDDLTHKLVDIIRINQRLGENIDAGAPQLIIEDLWELLQYHVSTYFDNETAGLPPARHRSGRQLRTIVQRLKGKEGRFRYNLSGKRVNFSARTVISPDPYLGINELGIPTEIAAELTVPLNVTKWNLESVKTFLKKHSEKVNYIIRADGRKKKLSQENIEEVLTELAPGYTVERQLMDGDYIIFNRQPSLHRVSMMAHKAKILSGKTFRFNTTVCTPYNADFDGDEMNVHVPQNEEAMAEAELLMKVEQNILSPRHEEPLVGPTHDHHSGTFLLTQDGLKLPKEYACRLMSIAGIEHEVEGDTIEGKKLFSMLLPKELSIEMKNRSGEEIIIEKGILKKGHVDSRVNDRIVKELFHLDPAKSTKYIDGISTMSVEITLMYGLSLSLADYELSDVAQKEISDHYKAAKKKINDLIEKYKTKKLERQPGKSLRETLEEQIMGIAEQARDDSSKIILKHVKRDPTQFFNLNLELNPALLMARSGARGSMLNVVQMTGLVGQQAVRGKRMTSGYKYRILPHFKQKDLSDEARGMVNRSFVDGLTPIQYFFHAAGGRDSVVDKGVNPAKTGYMQRRLINALQDFIVGEDSMVKDAEDNIVEFNYIPDEGEESIVLGDPVGVTAAQSIGEPGTQMSIPADEKVLVMINDAVKPVFIGEFIDALMKEHGFSKFAGADILNLHNTNIKVPALTQEGKMEWKELLQCSRHSCKKDILEITTRSGRRIRATENHSFVIRKNNEIIPVLGSTLKIGQRIPVVKNFKVPESNNIELEQTLPKTTHWFGSEYTKAMNSAISNIQSNYTIPVGASGLNHYVKGVNSFEIEDGFVYPMQNHSHAKIPEVMPLDWQFGWFVGAYLSEGSTTKYNVGISNTSNEFLQHVRAFAEKLNLKFSEKDNYRGFTKGHDLTINSSIISEFLVKNCNKCSFNKKIPEFAFSANNEFISALLSAYFDGDGNVSVQRNVIRVSSASKELIDGTAILLARFGIFCTKHSSEKENRLSIPGKYAKLFKEKIGFKIKEKQALLNTLCSLPRKKTNYDVVDMTVGFSTVLNDIARKLSIPSRYVNKFTKKQEIGRSTLEKYIQLFETESQKKNIDVKKELSILKNLLQEDVTWDEIVEIKLVKPTEKVYDFAVKGLQTFTTFDGIITHNTLRTFHYAGVASLAQLGFTRLVEIVDGRKTPKNPVMDVILKDKYAKNYEKVKEIAAKIEEITLQKIAKVKENFSKKSIQIEVQKDLLKQVNLSNKEIEEGLKKEKLEYEKHEEGFIIKFKESTLKEIRKAKVKLDELIIKGIKGITRAIIIDKGDGTYSIATEGTNLEEVMKIEEVDPSKTTTNDSMEIGRVLGIEAARNSIYNEIKKVLDAQGLKVSSKHLSLIADAMTVTGNITSIGRHGLAGKKKSVLARAAFEETSKHLVTAAIMGEKDDLKGITENIIIGQIIPAGTGKVKLGMKIS